MFGVPGETPLLLLSVYLLGGIPTGVMLAGLRGLADPRNQGSGNMGASNMARLHGLRWGLLTLAGDALKCALPLLLLRLGHAPLRLMLLCAVVGILGHCWSPWLRGQGGKGVASTWGALMALEPQLGGLLLLSWGLLWSWLRIPALASLGAAGICLLLSLLHWEEYRLFSIWICLLFTVRHRRNLRELREGLRDKEG